MSFRIEYRDGGRVFVPAPDSVHGTTNLYSHATVVGAYNFGLEEGRVQGYKAGYKDGYDAGWRAASSATEPQHSPPEPQHGGTTTGGRVSDPLSPNFDWAAFSS